MSLRTLYYTDPETSKSGVWIKYATNEDDKTDVRFKLSRMEGSANKAYAKELEKLTKPFKRELELETLDEAIGDKLMLEVFCRTILLDWENVRPNDDGVDLPFSFENAMTLLADPAWSDLLTGLREHAKKAATFRVADLEKDAKN